MGGSGVGVAGLVTRRGSWGVVAGARVGVPRGGDRSGVNGAGSEDHVAGVAGAVGGGGGQGVRVGCGGGAGSHHTGRLVRVLVGKRGAGGVGRGCGGDVGVQGANARRGTPRSVGVGGCVIRCCGWGTSWIT